MLLIVYPEARNLLRSSSMPLIVYPGAPNLLTRGSMLLIVYPSAAKTGLDKNERKKPDEQISWPRSYIIHQ